jgi:hypothetical protein
VHNWNRMGWRATKRNPRRFDVSRDAFKRRPGEARAGAGAAFWPRSVLRSRSGRFGGVRSRAPVPLLQVRLATPHKVSRTRGGGRRFQALDYLLEFGYVMGRSDRSRHAGAEVCPADGWGGSRSERGGSASRQGGPMRHTPLRCRTSKMPASHGNREHEVSNRVGTEPRQRSFNGSNAPCM